jgi:fumarate reductase subunit C
MKGKEYVRPIPRNWWLKKRSYTLFMIRELTAVFVAGYAVFLLFLLYRVSQGPDVFAGFVEGLKSPLSISLHVLALVMALYHSITFFNLSGAVTRIYRGEERVPPAMIIAPNYVAWLVVSALVAWIAVAASKGQ